MAFVKLESVTVRYQLHNPYSMNLKRSIVTFFSSKLKENRSVLALDCLSLDLDSGDRVALIGENGAGKTTLLRVLSGSLPPIEGKVTTVGSIHSFLGSPLQGLDPEMSGYENIEYVSLINGRKVKKGSILFNEIADFSGLADRLNDPVFTYSTGMRARLRFSILTSFTPEILLLDEGIGAADFGFSLQSKTRLKDFLGRAGILVLASHSPDFAKQFCTSGLWMSKGKIVQSATIDETYSSYISHIKARDIEPI